MPKPGARNKQETHYSDKPKKQDRPQSSDFEDSKSSGKSDRPGPAKRKSEERPKRAGGFSKDRPEFKKSERKPFRKSDEPYQKREEQSERPSRGAAGSKNFTERTAPRKRTPISPDAKREQPKKEMGYTERKALENNAAPKRFADKREGGFAEKREGGFGGKREGGFGEKREGGFAGKREGGFEGKREGGSAGKREGGFGGKREGGFDGKREGDYAGKREGGFGGKREGGFEGKREGDYAGKREGGFGGKPPFKKEGGRPGAFRKDDRKGGKFVPENKTDFEGTEFTEFSDANKPGKWNTEVKDGPMTLNKYVAHSGVCSRRDAATLIKDGKVTVNGEILKEPGYRVKEDDKVSMEGNKLTPQRNFVYVLLNKPKDFLTTTEDDRGRRTVMELVKGATDDRLYPIGRLDRNTTGILLMTNDGDLAQRLSHPKFESKKIYQVTLDKDLTKRDFEQIVEGVTLEDGPARVDKLAYLEKKNEVGLEIHSGRNRIVRRIFEELGYDVVKLDRVVYAGLTKKNVTRGSWRFLTEKEVINLKHFKN